MESSKSEKRMKHAALITILIYQSVSEADSLFISNFTAVTGGLKADHNRNIVSVQTAVTILEHLLETQSEKLQF